jgi:hypothetical protein
MNKHYSQARGLGRPERDFPDRRESVLGGCGKNILFFTLRKIPLRPTQSASNVLMPVPASGALQ